MRTFHARLFGGVALATIVCSPPATAQNQEILAKIKQLDEQAPQPGQDIILAALTKTAVSLANAGNGCKPSRITILETSPITGARDILAGIMKGAVKNGWTVYARYAGCPGGDVFRYAVIQRADGSLIAPLINEGRSYANLSIMRDTSALAAIAGYAAIKRIDAKCAGGDLKMGQTRVVSETKDLGPDTFGVRYTGSWTEIWQFKSCGRTVEVAVSFSADGDGGAYSNIKGDSVTVLANP